MAPKGMDQGSGRRRMLLLRIFPQKFSAQERVERCMDAFHELHYVYAPTSTDEEMLKKVRLFVAEADSILADGHEEKDGLAQTLSKHPWFSKNGQEVKYDPATNILSLAVLGAVAVDWDEADGQEDDEEKKFDMVKEEEEARGGDSAPAWREEEKESWRGQRAEDRSRSPPPKRGTGYSWGADAGSMDAGGSMSFKEMNTTSKAKAFPPLPSAVVSKAAAVAAGHTLPRPPPKRTLPTKAEPGELDNVEARRYTEALLRCLPEDIRPWDASGSVIDLLAACHTARGNSWPNLQQVGGGTGGSSSISDLHELSVALLSRVREKALAEAVPVEEGTDLTTMFVKENKLGAEAEAALRELPPTANLRVIGAGSVAGCDPEAVIMARIRRGREAVSAPTFPLSPGELAAFIEKNWVSTDAERALRMCPFEVQRLIVADGPLLGQTPSTELLERIDQAQIKAMSAAAA